MKAILTFGVLLFSNALFSQSSHLEGRGVLGQGLWSENIAGVSRISYTSFGVSVENRFGLSELSYAKLRAATSTQWGVFQGHWNTFGDQLYSHIPLRGTDYFVQLSYRLRKKLQLYARCNYESKTNNEADDFGLQSVNNTRQLKFVFQWKYNMGDLNLKNRIAWSAVNKDMGHLMSQDLSYKPLEKPFALSLRYVLFDTPSFASRIYAYEPDVMYSFSVPFHYGEGQRLSAVLRYKIKNVTLNAKLAQTLYYDNTDIKSGSVEANKSTEIKLVLKWVL